LLKVLFLKYNFVLNVSLHVTVGVSGARWWPVSLAVFNIVFSTQAAVFT